MNVALKKLLTVKEVMTILGGPAAGRTMLPHGESCPAFAWAGCCASTRTRSSGGSASSSGLAEPTTSELATVQPVLSGPPDTSPFVTHLLPEGPEQMGADFPTSGNPAPYNADLNGPSWIRTRDQPVMSGAPGRRIRSHRVATREISSTPPGCPPSETTPCHALPWSAWSAGGPARAHPGVDASGGGDRLLTVREVAERLAVSAPIVYSLCERGEIRHIRISNAIRVLPEDLEAFLAAQQG